MIHFSGDFKMIFYCPTEEFSCFKNSGLLDSNLILLFHRICFLDPVESVFEPFIASFDLN